MPLIASLSNPISLETARRFAREGIITEDEWLAYRHAWQTGAPRFAVRACNCAECLVNYPSPEFKAL